MVVPLDCAHRAINPETIIPDSERCSKTRPLSGPLGAEEAASINCSAIVLLMIWMMMTPVPVIALLPAGCEVELAIVSVPFAKINAVGTVFAFIPCMVVMMIAIVVAGMIAAGGNYNFLGTGL